MIALLFTALCAGSLAPSAKPAEPSLWAAADDAATVEARALHAQGKAAYDADRFQEALTLFEGAFQRRPLPGFLFNIGQCLRKLGRHGEAARAFERYLEAQPDASNREDVEALIAEERAAAAPAPPPPSPPALPPVDAPLEPPPLSAETAPAPAPGDAVGAPPPDAASPQSAAWDPAITATAQAGAALAVCGAGCCLTCLPWTVVSAAVPVVGTALGGLVAAGVVGAAVGYVTTWIGDAFGGRRAAAVWPVVAAVVPLAIGAIGVAVLNAGQSFDVTRDVNLTAPAAVVACASLASAVALPVVAYGVVAEEKHEGDTGAGAPGFLAPAHPPPAATVALLSVDGAMRF
jgi:hypothetical protein